MNYSLEKIEKIVKFWNLNFLRIRKDFLINGSPARSDFRVVIETKDAQLFLLENFSIKLEDKKQEIAEILTFLQAQKISKINPYIQNKEGKYFFKFEEKKWQIQKFIRASNLDRVNFVFDEWRGNVLAQFLIDLKSKIQDVNIKSENLFSLKKYVYQIYQDIQNYNSEIIFKINPILNFLENKFFKIYDDFPLKFCHGDYHPLNVIWSKSSIKAVIDWEFCGYKAEIYDVANMVSCVGMENPEALTQGLIISFLKTMQKSKLISDLSWKYLLEFMVAIRFAWLAEWLRKKDAKMIDLELFYMNLLVKHHQALAKFYLFT